MVYSLQKSNGQTVPGIDGLFYLNGYTMLDSGNIGSEGMDQASMTIPNDPNLVGKTVYLQAVCDYGNPDAAFSNLLSLEIL